LVFKGILKTEWGSEAGALPSHSVGKVGATACGCACFVHKGIQHVYLLNERGEASPRFGRIRPIRTSSAKKLHRAKKNQKNQKNQKTHCNIYTSMYI